MKALAETQTTLDANAAFEMNNDGIFVVLVAGERLGIPVSCVQTIFRIDRVTPVPGAPREVIGLVNLRGHIVTAVGLRRRLGMQDGSVHANPLAIGIEHLGESFALVVDEVGDGFLDAADSAGGAAFRRLDAGRQSVHGVADTERLLDRAREAFIAARGRLGLTAKGRVARCVFHGGLILEDHLVQPFTERHA
jgi:hypothetical protein